MINVYRLLKSIKPYKTANLFYNCTGLSLLKSSTSGRNYVSCIKLQYICNFHTFLGKMTKMLTQNNGKILICHLDVTKYKPLETEYALKEDYHLLCNQSRAMKSVLFKESTTGCTNIITHGPMQRRDAAREQYTLCFDFQRITMVARGIKKMGKPLEPDKIHAEILKQRRGMLLRCLHSLLLNI